MMLYIALLILARNYPILPNVDYDASANYIDIGYNDFLYDNIEPFFKYRMI